MSQSEEDYNHFELLIQNHLQHCWLFKLDSISLKYIFGFCSLYWIVGFVVALLAGDAHIFVTNPISLAGPGWLLLGLLAYRWFAKAYRQTLIRIMPAFDMTPDRFLAQVRHSMRYMNNISVFVLYVIFLVILYIDFLEVWDSTDFPAFILDWTQSSSWALRYYFISFQTVCLAMILSTGIVGIAGSLYFFSKLANNTIRLSYFRRLEEIISLSVGIGLWTIVSWSQILIITSFFRIDAWAQILLSTLATLALISSIVLPVILTHNLMLRSKKKHSIKYEALHDINQGEIRELISHVVLSEIDDEEHPVYSKLKLLKTIQDDIDAAIKYIEDIPAWSLHWTNVIRILSGASVIPFITFIVNNIP